MFVITHTCGEAYWWRSEETELEQEDWFAEATARIRASYDAGEPLFTKEKLREIDKQLDALNTLSGDTTGQKVFVEGLDGNKVEFEIRTGRVRPPNFRPPKGKAHKFEFVLTKPFIYYSSLQKKLSRDFNYIPRLAYCNLEIQHYMDERDVVSKELVSKIQPKSSSKRLVSQVPIPPLEDIEAFFQSVRTSWEASAPCQQLRSILSSTRVKCDKIVGLALSTMAHGTQEDEGCCRSAFQHALVLTLRDILKEKMNESLQLQNNSLLRGDTIKCYTQDPAYTDVDTSILKENGIRVLEDPKGFLEIDDSTAVISCAPDLPVKEIVLDISQPALILWDRVEEQDPKYLSTDPDSTLVRETIRKFYDSYDFPKDFDHFGDLVIYVRRSMT